MLASPRRAPAAAQEDDTPEDEYVAKFVLLRDPNKPSMYLYNVAHDAFDRVDEREVGEEAEGDGWGADEGAEAAGPAAGAAAAASAAPSAAAGAAIARAPSAGSAAGRDEDDSSPMKKPGAKGS